MTMYVRSNSFANAGPDLRQTPPISISARLVTPSCFAFSSVSSIYLVSITLENVGPPASLGMIYNSGKWVLMIKNDLVLLNQCWQWLTMALRGKEVDEGDKICGAIVSLCSKVDCI